MTIQEQLDLLSDYQSQIDLLNLQKQELLDGVQIPAEVLAAQDEAIKRRLKLDTEFWERQKAAEQLKIEALAAVPDPEMPPEFVAALEAARLRRGEIEAQFNQTANDDLRALREAKAKVDDDLQLQIRDVYNQVEQRKAEISAEFAGKVEAANANIAKLTAAVKAEVIKAGQTVKGKFLQAVYVKGRVTWDTAKLDGLMILLPQLKDARKEGEPSITIRRIG
jgi:hypothetical protein